MFILLVVEDINTYQCLSYVLISSVPLVSLAKILGIYFTIPLLVAVPVGTKSHILIHGPEMTDFHEQEISKGQLKKRRNMD